MDALSLLPDYQTLPVEARSRLVIITAQRARQLMQGAHPAMETKHAKPTTIALEEVLNGHVRFLVGKEAQTAMKDARKRRERELEKLTMAKVASAGADVAEVKQEGRVSPADAPLAEASEDD